ncbi:MAG: DNA primase [Candidatus Saccharimonadaceae bacterium]
MDAKEEVRSRIAIEDVIGEYVQLKRAGRNFKGLSPFSQERTPSFFVSPEKQIWHDFSSNRGGDVFSFVMEVEGMDFRAALEHLARKAGVDLSLYEDKKSGDLARRKKRLIEAHKLAANYYQHCLLKSKQALEYVVKTRGFNRQIVTDFLLGYAPDNGEALTGYLASKGFSQKELSDAGLTSRYGKDLFRGRMMVPLMDPSGQVIGFTGRILGDVPNAPKYLNTPQTLIYDKSRHVFAFSQAKEAIRTTNTAVVVEGNLDVVSSHQAGVRQVVATAGTALTEHHLRAIKRLTSDIRLSFDGDKAGIAATERAIGIASQLEVNLSIVSMPDDAKDPDELIRADPASWTQAIESAVPAMDWLIGHYAAGYDLATAVGKRNFTSKCLEVVSRLTDLVEQEHYQEIIAKLVDTNVDTIKKKMITSRQDPKRLRKVEGDFATINDEYIHQDTLLALLLIDGPSQDLLSNMDISMLSGEPRLAVARYLLAHIGKSVTDTPAKLKEYDTYVKILLLKADARYADFSEQDRYFEAARLVRQLEQENRKQNQARLVTQLRQAEEQGDEKAAGELRQELNILIKEIARGKRR